MYDKYGIEPVLLEKEYKDHTIVNAVNSLLIDDLPSNVYSIHQQPIRNMSVTIQIIDENTSMVIETITGKTESGSVSIDSSSLIRRTADLTLQIDPDLFPRRESLIWFNRIAKVYVGMEDLSNYGEVTNFLLGTFWIDNVSLSVGTEDRISVSLSDKMTRYEDMKLETQMKLDPDTPIHESIKLLMEMMGETEFGYIEECEPNEVIPYTMNYKIGDSVLDVLKKLRDMYMDYVCGYNVNGEFEFRKITTQREEDIQETKWIFDTEAKNGMDLTMSFKEDYDLKGIKNRITVYGATGEKSGYTPSGEVRITDPRSPFNVYAIGKRSDVLIENKYVTDEQCLSKAKFEVWKTSTFQEKCIITCPPIYILDTLDVIEVKHPVTKVVSKYAIDNATIGLGIDGTMSITAHKIYTVSLEYGEEKLPIVDTIIKGINNYGWISLGEERIRDCYNIMGDGTATIIVRFQDNAVGGEQASIISYATTNNQTLIIDLADFEDIILDEQNGATLHGNKGDYLDRVIAHEMVHAVMNDFFGHDLIIQFPIWFKEGFAEFLHGAKDRFLTVHSDLSKQEKKEALVSLAEKQLRGGWESSSNDYVSAYLIAIAIYRLSSREHWRNLFPRIKSERNAGINFLQKLLPIAETTDGVVSRVVSEIENMDDVWSFLYDENDVDTGSVGGSHFMNIYNMPLDSETVFNNFNATDASIGFLLKFEK